MSGDPKFDGEVRSVKAADGGADASESLIRSFGDTVAGWTVGKGAVDSTAFVKRGEGNSETGSEASDGKGSPKSAVGGSNRALKSAQETSSVSVEHDREGAIRSTGPIIPCDILDEAGWEEGPGWRW